MEEISKSLEGKISEADVDEVVGKLLKSGDLFRPKRGFVQRMYTPFSSFVTSSLHQGHSVGIVKDSAYIGLLSWRTFTTWGMISPAFSIITVSSARTSRRFSSSKLWRLARFTVVPAS